jgi:hypothetical protein
MIELIGRHRAELIELCCKYQVRTLEVFGSAADGTFDPAQSDLDFLVEFLPEAAQRIFSGFFDLREELERLFGRKVDLVMPRAIRNPYFLNTVNQHRELLFAA